MEEPKQLQSNIKMTPGNRKQKGRRSAPKIEGRRIAIHNNPIAYRFKDSRVGEFDVLNSDRAWWIGIDGAIKLQKLVDSYCFYYTDDEACSYAGVSKMQLEYFQKLHPEFYGIKHTAKSQPDMHAKKKLVDAASKDVGWAAWWLQRTQKETFSPRVETTSANGRDLFDGLAQEIRKLSEELLKNDNGDDITEEEHVSELAPGYIDAGQDGDGHEATLAGNEAERPEAPTEIS